MSPVTLRAGRRLGPYEIVAAIGAGGMGEVYRARDTRLKRDVAIKALAEGFASDPVRMARFQREGEALAAVNHPHVASMYDVIELEGATFLVLEFVEGETLRTRMERGAMAIGDALEIAMQLASALAAAHARGIIHRDIKPENVMLRPDGFIKVLDFGLATVPADDQVTVVGDIGSRTSPGMVLGTPHYMSPEQARGWTVDARSDIWSFGVVLYEMVAGKRPFDGASPADVLGAILRGDAPPLERVAPRVPASLASLVRTALAREPAARFTTAHDLQDRLSAVRGETDPGAGAGPSATSAIRTRLIVLPFRLLRPDTSVEFLAFSLPDAVSASLANLETVIVRSNVVATHYDPKTDLSTIARETGVDLVVTGTLLSFGGKVRLTAQLVEGESGTLVWSYTTDAAVSDLFTLQDGLVERVVGSLAVPLSGRDRRQLQLDVPASPAAYEYYLRANEASRDPKGWKVAAALYRQAVEHDPRFAAAWARYARVCRLLAKYRGDDADATLALAEDALRKALHLNPNLSVAHRLYAQIDVDRGRADEALPRLIARARDRGGDAELFAALVHVCRNCGLLDKSLAADACARRIDPAIDTGVMHTYWLLHRYEEAIATSGTVKAYVVPASLVALGRQADARAVIIEVERHSGNRVPLLASAVLAFMDGRHDDGVEALLAQAGVAAPDPELLFYVGRHLGHVGEAERALPVIARALDLGYFCYPVMASDPWLDALRAHAGFQPLLDRAERRWASASAMFVAAGGDVLLGATDGHRG